MPAGRTPRAWQIRAIEASRVWLAGHRSGIVSAATGTGKGTVIAAIAVMSARRGKRVVILTNRDELVADLDARVRAIPDHPDVGVVQQRRNEWLNPIVVASIQSCTAKRRQHVGRVNLVITDEAHHSLAPSYRKFYDAVEQGNPSWRHLGMTATPFRSAKNGGTTGLGLVFDAVVYEHGIVDAISAGDLVPLKAFQVSTLTSLEDVGVGVSGDFEEHALQIAVDTPDRNRIVVEQYAERCQGLPALVFAAGIEHALHLAEAFRAAGVVAEAAWGDMPVDDRRRVIGTFRNDWHKLPVVVSCDLIREGFDAPECRAILKARPTKSRLVFTQMVGRGLRTAPGKSDCIFVDFVDNGCDLDLATVADLSKDEDAANTGRPFAAGDPVMRRHHDDWAVGVLLHVDTDATVPWGSVEWGPSRVRRAPEILDHPLRELKRPPADREPRPVEIRPVEGVNVYEVFLLPGQRVTENAVGFYEYHGAWTASGWSHDDGKVAVHVSWGADSAAWEVWEVRRWKTTTGGWADEVKLLHKAPLPNDAIRFAQNHIRVEGVRIAKLNADWKAEPASEAQVTALRRWRIRRDLSRISKGEASALLDAVAAGRRVRDARRSDR